MAAGTPNRYAGLDASSVNNYVLDAGEIRIIPDDADLDNLTLAELKGGVKLGATRGGAVFTIQQTFRDVEVDGTLGPIKGQRRIIDAGAMLTATMLEFDKEALQNFVPGITVDDSGNSTHVVIKRTRQISNDDYIPGIAILAAMSNNDEPFIGILKNVLQTGEMAITFDDDNEAVVPLEFTAHFDVSSGDFANEPWEIWTPKR